MRQGAFFFGGVVAGIFLSVCLLPPGAWLWLGLCSLVPVGVLALLHRPRALALCLGLTLALNWCSAYRVLAILPAQRLHGQRARVEVLVSTPPEATRYGARVECYLSLRDALPAKAILYGGEELLELTPGDRVNLCANCTAADRRTLSGGVAVTLTAAGKLDVTPAPTPWWALPRCWGARLEEAVTAAFPEDTAGFMAALVSGNTHGLADTVRSDLSRSGIAHLAAVSGMHLCFLMGFLTLFLGRGLRRQALVGIPLLFLFALMTGGRPSALRAAVMQSLLLLAPLLGRENDPPTSILMTLSLLLLGNPYGIANVGLQMSFGAVVGLSVVTPRLRARFEGEDFPRTRTQRFLQKVGRSLSVSIGAQLFTVPLAAYYFGSVSLVAPLTNLLVIPLAPILFAGTLLTGALYPLLPGAGTALAWLLSYGARWVLWVARTLAGIPLGAVTAGTVYFPLALLGCYVLGILAFSLRGRRRLRVYAACAGVLLLCAGVLNALSLHQGLTVTAFRDNTALLLTSRGKSALFHCGAGAGDAAADHLLDRGTRRLDKLLLPDCSPSKTAGAEALFYRLDVREVYLPPDAPEELVELAYREGAAITWLTGTTDLTLGESQLTLHSEVAALTARRGDFRLTAAEAPWEGMPPCQVLITAHAEEPLLSAAQSQVAVLPTLDGDTRALLDLWGVLPYPEALWGNITIRVK